MYKLQAHKLSKRFGGLKVFAQLDFELSTGQSMAVVGPNGSGKSTLLMVLLSLYTPTKGEVVYLNDDAKMDDAAVRAKVALVSPYLNLYDQLTAEENIKFFATVSGHNIAGKAINELLVRVGLEGRGVGRPRRRGQVRQEHRHVRERERNEEVLAARDVAQAGRAARDEPGGEYPRTVERGEKDRSQERQPHARVRPEAERERRGREHPGGGEYPALVRVEEADVSAGVEARPFTLARPVRRVREEDVGEREEEHARVRRPARRTWSVASSACTFRWRTGCNSRC